MDSTWHKLVDDSEAKTCIGSAMMPAAGQPLASWATIVSSNWQYRTHTSWLDLAMFDEKKTMVGGQFICNNFDFHNYVN